MERLYVIRRNPLISVWFLLLGVLLWYKLFGGLSLLEDEVLLFLSVVVALFLLLVPVLYLSQRIIVEKESFVYRTLFSKKTIDYGMIRSVSYQVSKKHYMDNNDIDRFHSVRFQYVDGTTLKIPFHFFVGKNRGSVLINQAVSVNPNISLDEMVKKIRDSEDIAGIYLSRVLLFLFSNGAIFFAITIIP